ncbi:TolC family protein [Cedecea neteri]|uniref:TolC family protein n=1 Tax=Cedecea neteri TaxID=158822 RepID=A0A291DSG9_9ENTR|nr:TolC family protein [Cedecea neteri]ATF90586.1 TolC family protein [Cedecea neteri]
MNFKKPAFLLLCLLCAGCGSMLRTEYHTPVINFSSSEVGKKTDTESVPVEEKWWGIFNDKLLSSIIYTTLQNNNDLHAAALRLQQSKLDSGEINTNLVPDFNMSLGANSSRMISQSAQTSESYSSSLSMSYELDLWGKLARTRERGQWNVEASAEDLHNTELVIIESISKSYWSIAKLNEQIEFNKQRLDIAKSTYEIVKAKYNSGAGTKSDVILAEKSIYSSELQLRNILSQRETERNTMLTIYNKDGVDLPKEKTRLDEFQDIKLPLYQSVDIISLRPDIRSAELKIKMAVAGYDLAKINFFPSVSLGATISAGSSIFTQWFSDQTLLQSISATFPPLQWRKLNFQLQKEKISVDLAVNDFRKAVLNALTEVKNALETRNNSQYAFDVQKKTLSISQDLMRMNTVKYKSGYISFQTLLDSQDDVLNQKSSYLDCQYDYLVSTMKFLLSVGGGEFNKKVNDEHGT